MLELEELHVHYGAVHALQGVSLQRRAGRDRHAHRGQRGGKVDHAARDERAGAPVARRDHGSRAVSLVGGRPHEVVRLGIAHSPEGRGVFANLTVDENLDLGAYTRRTARRSARHASACSPCSRGCKERVQPAVGHAVGGRAADAGDRAGAARAAAAAAAGRAVPRAGAADRPDDLPTSSGRSTPPGTTILLVEQNAHMALRGGPPRVRARGGSHRARGRRQEARRERRGPEDTEAFTEWAGGLVVWFGVGSVAYGGLWRVRAAAFNAEERRERRKGRGSYAIRIH
jgi:branched-chain amino acid transport system ATP-binding protein